MIDQGRARPAGRRHGHLHVPRPRALAPESGLLLRGRRRADARHGTLLHHRSRQSPSARSRRLRALRRRPARSVLITSEARNGERHIPVHVPTHVAGIMAFANGAVVQIGMSFDVAGHKHVPLELYGTEGTLIVPDPNHFGGEVQLLKKGGSLRTAGTDCALRRRQLPLARRCRSWHTPSVPIGRTGQTADLALHVLEVMEAFHAAVRNRHARSAISHRDGAPGAAVGFPCRWTVGQDNIQEERTCAKH